MCVYVYVNGDICKLIEVKREWTERKMVRLTFAKSMNIFGNGLKSQFDLCVVIVTR